MEDRGEVTLEGSSAGVQGLKRTRVALRSQSPSSDQHGFLVDTECWKVP